MTRKRLLPALLLLPLVAVSGAAHAGPTIANKNYWPNEVGPWSYDGIKKTETDRRRARTVERGTGLFRAAPEVNSGQYRCRYQGGPKLPMTCSREP